jgi:hypothetical protein
LCIKIEDGISFVIEKVGSVYVACWILARWVDFSCEVSICEQKYFVWRLKQLLEMRENCGFEVEERVRLGVESMGEEFDSIRFCRIFAVTNSRIAWLFVSRAPLVP